MQLRGLTILVAISILSAALTAPPSAFAETTQPTTTTPALTLAPPVPAPAAERPVRIRLGRSSTGVTVGATGGLTIVAGGAVVKQLPAGQSAQLTLVSGKVQVAGLTTPVAPPVRLVPTATPPTPNYSVYNSRTYRGEIEITISPVNQALQVINVVNLEDYLLGVVPWEMPSSWPLEALKAQTVAARTYTLTHLGKNAAEGFDMVNTTDDQVYGGVPAETPRTSQAVAGTKGLVLTFGGKLAGTYYFSSSGGYTENNEVVWGGIPIAYLRAVPDFDDLPGNEYFSWRYYFTMSEFAQKLRSASYDVGDVAGIAPAGVRSISGRPPQWQVAGGNRIVTIKAADFRGALGLPGLVRTVVIRPSGYVSSNRTLASADPVYVMGADRTPRQRPMRDNYLVGNSRTPGLPTTAAAVVGPPVWQEGGVEVVGGGRGHALGLSQWGANGLAVLGKTYDQILTYFYQGTKVVPSA